MQALKVFLPVRWLGQALVTLGALQLQRARQHHFDHMAVGRVHDTGDMHEEAYGHDCSHEMRNSLQAENIFLLGFRTSSHRLEHMSQWSFSWERRHEKKCFRSGTHCTVWICRRGVPWVCVVAVFEEATDFQEIYLRKIAHVCVDMSQTFLCQKAQLRHPASLANFRGSVSKIDMH